MIHELNFETDADIVVFDQYFNENDAINVTVSSVTMFNIIC